MFENPGVPRDELVERLMLAYGAANGKRRESGGEKALELLAELKDEMKVYEIPKEPFPERGYLLYQEAYLMRLTNRENLALDTFEESALADEEWAKNHEKEDPDFFLAKSAMSRLAKCAYKVDIIMFGDTTTGALNPDPEAMKITSDEIRGAFQVIEGVFEIYPSRERWTTIERFRLNGILHLTEALAWLNEQDEIEELLVPKNLYLEGETDKTMQSSNLATCMARGVLAHVQGRHPEVINLLQDQPQDRVDFFAGEGAGKVAVLLLLAYMHTGNANKAEKTRKWILNKCPVDSGNGLAFEWAKQLNPIGY